MLSQHHANSSAAPHIVAGGVGRKSSSGSERQGELLRASFEGNGKQTRVSGNWARDYRVSLNILCPISFFGKP